MAMGKRRGMPSMVYYVFRKHFQTLSRKSRIAHVMFTRKFDSARLIPARRPRATMKMTHDYLYIIYYIPTQCTKGITFLYK